ncbi:MAG: PAS domain S-box protein, partial [Syntrophales bacterium]|nr:PAS domain S-box protein [Syntrophales bacterium]
MKEAEFFDHLPQTVFAVDAEGLIIRINRTAPSMFGYEKTDALLGMALETLFSPPDRERIGVMLAKARDGLQVPEQEFTGLRKDGSLFPAALFVNGGPSGSGWVCGIVCSLEAARRYQRRVLQEAKMEAVMTLAGGIAHDFNNLLMGIQGYVSLMMADLRKGHPHYRRLLGIERQIQTGSELTNQLLGFARMGQYNRTKTDLNALLAQVVSLFRRRKKGLRMAVTYGEGLW